MASDSAATIREFKCPHGVGPMDGRFDGVWAAPFSTCQCCGVHFPYIDRGWSGTMGTGGESWTKNRCAQCGGHYKRWGDGPHS